MISKVQINGGKLVFRRKPARFFAAGLLAAVLLGCASWPLPARAQEDSWEEDFQSAPPPGKSTFASTCAGCHGLDARGGERAPNIATAKAQRMSDAQIANVISNGVPGTGMPAFHTLSPAQVKNLVGYIRTLQGKVASRTLPGDATRGKAIFFGKAECSSCHTISGQGGFLGPDLTSYGANVNPAGMVKTLTSSSRVVPTGYRAAAATTKDGSRIEGLVRNEDNFSLQLLTRDGTFHFFEKADLKNLEYAAEPLMPNDYDKRLTRTELNDLISYLMTAAAPRKADAGSPAHKKAAE